MVGSKAARWELVLVVCGSLASACGGSGGGSGESGGSGGGSGARGGGAGPCPLLP